MVPTLSRDAFTFHWTAVTSFVGIGLLAVAFVAWRLRVGWARNWQPESSFDDAVLQTDIARWSAPALVAEPDYENPNALLLEPRLLSVT